MAILNQIGGISTGGLTGALEGPLSALFGTKKGVQMFQYPNNLGNDPSRMHIVQFEIRNVIPRKFEVTNEEEIDKGVENFASGLQSSYNTKFTSSTSEVTETSIGKTTSFTTSGIDVNKNVSVYLSPKKTKNAAIISLYMPDTLSMNYNQEYNELMLADIGGGILTAGAAGLSAAKSIYEGYEKGGFSGAFGAAGQSDTISDVTTALSAVGGQTTRDINDLFLKTQAKALNPQIQLLYRGVGLRTFSMEFTFTPKSKEEADQVSAIINTFVYASSPTVSGVGGMYFIPPSEININFLMAETGNFSGFTAMLQKAGNSIIPGLDLGNALLGGSKGTSNDRLYKVGTSVIESISVDYAPNGWSAHSNGAPVQTRLTMNFREIDIVDRTRLKAGDVR
jgi:hypothetical protein